MKFENKVTQEAAEAEVEGLMDRLKIRPKRREGLKPAIEELVESVMLGFTDIKDDGTITLTLQDEVDGIKDLNFAARVNTEIVNKNVAGLKVDTMTTRNMVYLKALTGKLEATLNKLESADRNTAESIALFFW